MNPLAAELLLATSYVKDLAFAIFMLVCYVTPGSVLPNYYGANMFPLNSVNIPVALMGSGLGAMVDIPNISVDISSIPVFLMGLSMVPLLASPDIELAYYLFEGMSIPTELYYFKGFVVAAQAILSIIGTFIPMVVVFFVWNSFF